MKTLFFAFIGVLFFFPSRTAKANDSYLDLPWQQTNTANLPQNSNQLTAPPLSIFKSELTAKTVIIFNNFILTCGIPQAELLTLSSNPEKIEIARSMPSYHGGHAFRYDLSDGGHVYVWTTEEDQFIAEAIYRSKTGKIEQLYKKTL